MAACSSSTSARARAKDSGGWGSSWARRQWRRAAADDSVQTPVAAQLALFVEARSLGEQAQARRGGAQRAGDDHQVARPRAAAAHRPRRLPEQGERDHDRPARCAARFPPTMFTPVSAARSSRPS